MSRICIAPIVEGHGEDQSIRILLQRVWQELLRGEYATVLHPIRVKRGRVTRPEELARALNLALLKLQDAGTSDRPLVLLLLDADQSLPCILGPELLALARSCRADADVAVVIANVEYETWFVAAAESLADYLSIQDPADLPVDPEKARAGKGWVERRFRGTKYSEVVDQPRMTAKLDLVQCRSHSRSFDKLCRELEKRR